MPELWSYFAVDLRNRDRIYPTIELMLIRSKDAPISFYVTSPEDDGPDMKDLNEHDEGDPIHQGQHRQDTVCWTLLFLIAEHADRWRSFNIDSAHRGVYAVVEDTFLKIAYEDPGPHLPNLEHASIPMAFFAAHMTYESVFKCAPNLSTLTLSYEYAEEYPEILPYMPTIRELILEVATDIPWTDIIRSCIHLRSLTFRGIRCNEDGLDAFHCPVYQKPDEPEPPVECKELESISIDVACVNWDGEPSNALIGSFSAALKAPSLRSLTIYAEDPHFDLNVFAWPRNVMTSFVSNTRGNLRNLSITNLPVRTEDLLALLELTPLLEELVVTEHCRSKAPYQLLSFCRDHTTSFHPTITRAFLDRLLIKKDSSVPPFLPKLRSISLFVHGRHFHEDRMFVKMVQSRCLMPARSAVVSLRRVELTMWMSEWKDAILDGTYDPLRVLERDHGVMISVTSLNLMGTPYPIV
ncbi:hypothetical protein PM082_002213 [Marasmius tenuissimus]|nr:hypothetical protein PM082_002213 [Marasmius tenuissimus]